MKGSNRLKNLRQRRRHFARSIDVMERRASSRQTTIARSAALPAAAESWSFAFIFDGGWKHAAP
jgi:hypothetical protein